MRQFDNSRQFVVGIIEGRFLQPFNEGGNKNAAAKLALPPLHCVIHSVSCRAKITFSAPEAGLSCGLRGRISVTYKHRAVPG